MTEKFSNRNGESEKLKNPDLELFKETYPLKFEKIENTCLYSRMVKDEAGVEHYQIIEEKSLEVLTDFETFNWDYLFKHLLSESVEFVTTAKGVCFNPEEPRSLQMERLNVLIFSGEKGAQHRLKTICLVQQQDKKASFLDDYLQEPREFPLFQIEIRQELQTDFPDLVSIAIYMAIMKEDFTTYKHSNIAQQVQCTDIKTGSVYFLNYIPENKGPYPTEAYWICERYLLKDLLVEGCLSRACMPEPRRIKRVEKLQHRQALKEIFGDKFELKDRPDFFGKSYDIDKLEGVYIDYR